MGMYTNTGYGTHYCNHSDTVHTLYTTRSPATARKTCIHAAGHPYPMRMDERGDELHTVRIERVKVREVEGSKWSPCSVHRTPEHTARRTRDRSTISSRTMSRTFGMGCALRHSEIAKVRGSEGLRSQVRVLRYSREFCAVCTA